MDESAIRVSCAMPRKKKSEQEPSGRWRRIVWLPVLFSVVAGVFALWASLPDGAKERVIGLVLPNPPPTVEINCTPERIPLDGQQTGSLFAVYLDAKWDGRVVSAPAASWPSWASPNDGAYRCEITASDNHRLYGMRFVFEVSVSGDDASPSATRRINIPSPKVVSGNEPLVLHIADDTRKAVEVVLPTTVSARVDDDTDLMVVNVRYSTRDGRPVRLRGFNP